MFSGCITIATPKEEIASRVSHTCSDDSHTDSKPQSDLRQRMAGNGSRPTVRSDELPRSLTSILPNSIALSGTRTTHQAHLPSEIFRSIRDTAVRGADATPQGMQAETAAQAVVRDQVMLVPRPGPSMRRRSSRTRPLRHRGGGAREKRKFGGVWLCTRRRKSKISDTGLGEGQDSWEVRANISRGPPNQRTSRRRVWRGGDLLTLSHPEDRSPRRMTDSVRDVGVWRAAA